MSSTTTLTTSAPDTPPDTQASAPASASSPAVATVEDGAPGKTAAYDTVLHAIRTHTQADNPSAFLAMSRHTSAFTAPGLDGVIAYRRAGRYLIQLGGPFAAPDAYRPLLDAFVAHAHGQGLTVVGAQLQHHDALAYAERGFTVNQFGSSWAVRLPDFTLRGSRFMRMRNKISRALRSGLHVSEVPAHEMSAAIDVIDAAWLGSKGEEARPLTFLVGELGGQAQEHRRLFVGTIDSKPVGYISYSPVYGSRAGWMHDLSRRIPDGTPGLMEAINSHAIEVMREEGSEWLHFGFTPFTGLDAARELPGHSASFQWLMHFLWDQGAALYPAQSQLAYKEKWAPEEPITEYVAFEGPASVAAFAHIFRACNAF
ncbi:bifunctional lysylphosphatidylglycerol flippase/synthetase MprF [Streptomyces lasiicapitis]|uniref:bifunctional lysylphosphatidylglycerol flippase/synthetase MprF n=1 Tax=Streptomyces lasiicapitis TaxID=1923961 RepID=UPI0036CB2C77